MTDGICWVTVVRQRVVSMWHLWLRQMNAGSMNEPRPRAPVKEKTGM